MMASLLKTAVLVGCWLATALCAGAELRYPVYPLREAPAMDGRWDDKAWEEVPAAVGFTSNKTGAFVLTRQTAFRMGCHGDNLYVAVRCEEPEPARITADPNHYRDGWYPDDNIEFFFTADNSSAKEPKQFVTNRRAARWSNFQPPAGAPASAAPEAPGADHWSVEMRFPLALLGIAGDPKAGRFWFNLGRAAISNPEAEKNSCFAPILGAFNRAGSFVQMAFQDAPTPEALAQARKDLNRLEKWLRERLWRVANVKEAFLAGREGDDSLAPFVALKRQAKEMLSGKNLAGAAALLIRYDALRADLSLPTKKLAFAVDTRQARDVAVWVNGQAIAATDGRWPVRLVEGLNVVGMTARAEGKAAGLRLRIAGQPEMEGRWRVGAAADDAWKAPAFDDRSWPKAETDAGGYLRIPEGSTGGVCFRQLVLWSEHHYGGLPCIQPKVREWGFSEKSMETLFHTLYAPPPLAFPLDEYQFVLDVPKGFTLLQEKYPDDDKGGKLNRRPRAVDVENVSHGNQPYTRYRFRYEPQFVQPGKLQCALIPLVLNGYEGADKSCKFHFRRLASGNLTELEQTLPVRVLPPLNGRMPKKVMISQYLAEPWVRFAGEGGGKLFPEHFEAHMRQSLDVGFNTWILGPGGDTYTKKVYDRVLERGGVVVLWGPNNYPIWGNINGAWALGKLMLETPELRARFLGEAERVKTTAQFCRSFATGAGAALFKDAVKTDIGRMLHGSAEQKFAGFPRTTIYWNDWECTPWGSPDMKDYKCFCFCDRCKSAFRQYAKLPEAADLSDETIKKDHRKEWSLFRSELDGRVNGLVRQACNELGLQYMYYDQVAHPDNWPPLKGQIDLAFPGWPGDGQAIGFGPPDGVGSFPVDQQAMDREMAFIREKVGMPRIQGQLFASCAYGIVRPSQAWPQSAITGRDGFMNAARLKPQIVRILASFHGGVDLNTSLERCAGQQYYLGEATRAISEFEGLFWGGERADHLAASAQIKYPNLLVLTKDGERLVLLFNEDGKPLEVELENKDLKPGQTATIWEKPGTIATPARMKVTVPAEDVLLVHIR